MTTAVDDDLLFGPAAPIEHSELEVFRKQDAAIAKMKAEYMPLKISGLDDKEGFKSVHLARMVVKNWRLRVEEKRKELKADSLAYGRMVDSEAKRVTALLEPIEAHLTNEEEIVVREKERIKREEEERKHREEQAKALAIQKRIDALLAVGCSRNPRDAAYMSEEEFQAVLAEETGRHLARI